MLSSKGSSSINLSSYLTHMTPTRHQEIQKTLMGFYNYSLYEAAFHTFKTLGYESLKKPTNQDETLFKTLKKSRFDIHLFDQEKIQLDKWKQSAFLFQLTDEELPAIFSNKKNETSSNTIDLNNPSSILFIAIELEDRIWKTEEMCSIAKEIDRHFVMPTIFLFRYGNLLTLLIHQKKKISEAKNTFSLIRNLRILHPTRPHYEMLTDLDSTTLKKKKDIKNCMALFDAWFEALSAYNREEKTFLQKAGMLAFA